ILADARAAGQQDAEARAEHGIGVALVHMGQPADAIPHVWRGFELYEDEESRLRALNDVGSMLLSVGDSAGAERALSEVVRRGGTPGVRHPGAARGVSLAGAARGLTGLVTGVAVLRVAGLRVRPGAADVGTGGGRERERHEGERDERANSVGHGYLRI